MPLVSTMRCVASFIENLRWRQSPFVPVDHYPNRTTICQTLSRCRSHGTSEQRPLGRIPHDIRCPLPNACPWLANKTSARGAERDVAAWAIKFSELDAF